MKFQTLRIQGLRCLSQVELQLAPGINVFVGDNGAGKTSLLEAAFLLSHARSFRTGPKEVLQQRGASELTIFAEVHRANGSLSRLGLGRGAARWEARVDGAAVPMGQLVRECAVVCFDPGAHALIAGGADERRRYLDWGVFHVEQSFLTAWRRYQRALKQRNSLLRSGMPLDEAVFAPWEMELAQSAAQVDVQRQTYIDRLRPQLRASVSGLLPELGELELRYRRGWADEHELQEVLRQQRARDLRRGHTTIGAHRADWSLVFENAPQREHLSRGQEKLAALACMVAQAQLYATDQGEWPVVCLDDLASELDQTHQNAVVEQLASSEAQVLLTGTDVPSALAMMHPAVFHVEQGAVSRLL